MTSLRLPKGFSFALLGLALGCAPTTNDPDASGGEAGGTEDGSGSEESTGATGTEAGDTGTTSADTGVADSGDGDGDSAGDGDGCTLPPNDLWTCTTDADCEISGDCCGCTAYNPSQGGTGNCGGSCTQNKCEEWGVTEAVCVAGGCVPLGASCNQATVTCESLPPDCGPDALPGVAGDCWSGHCIPTEDCDWVPDCSYCSNQQLCMYDNRGECSFQRCVDPLPECGPMQPVCACTGAAWCQGSCSPAPDGFACD